jgi:hypothetical protein
MRKIYFSFLVLVLLMVSTIAKAQYSVNITSDPENNYYSGDQGFDATEVATTLGTDTAALHELINAGGAVYIKMADESKSNTYTGNTNEFWQNINGVPQGYGDEGTCWFVGLRYDESVDEVTKEITSAVVDIYMGQMPNFFKNIYTDSELKATLYLVNGEKEASFNITLKVNAAPMPELPLPTTSLSALTIVKEYELALPFLIGKSYEGKTYSTTLEGIYEALGVTSEELDEVVADFTYTQMITGVTENDETTYSWSDELKKPEDAAGGAWFGRYINFDETTEQETMIGCAPKGWNTGGNTFYTQNITLAEDTFSIVSGQFPDVLKSGDTDYANLYIIVGDKAAKVKVYVDMQEPEVINPDEFTKVGEQNISVTAAIDNNYATKGFTIDMAAVVAALECTTDDLDDIYTWASEGELSDNHTEGSGGYYYNEEGYIANWGSSSAFFIARTETSLQDGKFTIGQMSGHFTDITEDQTVKAQLVFKKGAKYYAVNVEYTVKAPEQNPEEVEYTLASTEEVAIQIIPSADTYEWGNKTTLDLDYIEGVIGTNDFKLYADKADAEGKMSWSDNYTCTPAPGFWFGVETYENEEHQVIVSHSTWGTNSFGMTYADGEITWWQFPGQRTSGDQYEANIYFVNVETGAYMKYILHVKYVDEVTPEGELAGTEDTLFLVSPDMYDDNLGMYVAHVDMSKAFEALGITDELAPDMADLCTVFAPKSQTIFETRNVEEAIFYNQDGYCVADDNESAILSAMVSTEEDGTPILAFDDQGYFEMENATAKIRIGLEYNGKRYLHIVTLTNDVELATGIQSATVQTAAAGIYNAAGVKVNALQKGINIVKFANGEIQKVFVK